MTLPALLLAAGHGVRLDPLTRLVAKPAVPLGDRTLIEHLLERLARQGVAEVVVNLHHLPHTITGVVGDGSQIGVRIRYSWEHPEVLGSAGGPRHALPLLDADQFLIVNGDTIADLPLAPLLDAHRTSGAEATLAVIPNPAPDRYGGVLVDDRGTVTGFARKGEAQAGWHFVGVQVANATLFAPLADGVPVESVGQVYREAIAARPGSIRAWPTTSRFIDVGTPRDYLEAALAFDGEAIRPRESHLSSSTALQDLGGDSRGLVIWPDASVHPDADVSRCIVVSGVQVPPGFAARDAMLLPVSVSRPGDRCDIQDDIAVFPVLPAKF